MCLLYLFDFAKCSSCFLIKVMFFASCAVIFAVSNTSNFCELVYNVFANAEKNMCDMKVMARVFNEIT